VSSAEEAEDRSSADLLRPRGETPLFLVTPQTADLPFSKSRRIAALDPAPRRFLPQGLDQGEPSLPRPLGATEPVGDLRVGVASRLKQRDRAPLLFRQPDEQPLHFVSRAFTCVASHTLVLIIRSPGCAPGQGPLERVSPSVRVGRRARTVRHRHPSAGKFLAAAHFTPAARAAEQMACRCHATPLSRTRIWPALESHSFFSTVFRSEATSAQSCCHAARSFSGRAARAFSSRSKIRSASCCQWVRRCRMACRVF